MEYSLASLVKAAEGIGLAEAARRIEMKYNGISRETIDEKMTEALRVMRQSAERGFDSRLRSMSGMTGGQAPKLLEAVIKGETVGGKFLGRAAARALAIAECNAAMGKIVAAPTAGLHFTKPLLEQLSRDGFELDEVTLHVGAGTFRPVATPTIGEHAMHSETIVVRRSLIENLIRHIGSPIIPVGTTSTRTLESLYWIGMMLTEQGMDWRPLHVEQWYPYEEHPALTTRESLEKIIAYLDLHQLTHLEASTALMIAPSYQMRVITGLITNFHQPKSTLLLLVSALIGERWKKAYRFALDNGFRFLSYGDSCLFF